MELYSWLFLLFFSFVAYGQHFGPYRPDWHHGPHRIHQQPQYHSPRERFHGPRLYRWEHRPQHFRVHPHYETHFVPEHPKDILSYRPHQPHPEKHGFHFDDHFPRRIFDSFHPIPFHPEPHFIIPERHPGFREFHGDQRMHRPHMGGMEHKHIGPLNAQSELENSQTKSNNETVAQDKILTMAELPSESEASKSKDANKKSEISGKAQTKSENVALKPASYSKRKNARKSKMKKHETKSRKQKSSKTSKNSKKGSNKNLVVSYTHGNFDGRHGPPHRYRPRCYGYKCKPYEKYEVLEEEEVIEEKKVPIYDDYGYYGYDNDYDYYY